MAHPSSRDDAWEAFLDVWDRLLEASETPGTVLVVEGENDVKSLRRLGIDGPIRPLHRGQRLPLLARELGAEARRVVLLFDWDLQGGRWTRKLKELLGPDVDVDTDLRRRIAATLRGEIVHVEGLYGWARRQAEAHGAPLEHFRPDLQGFVTTPVDPEDEA